MRTAVDTGLDSLKLFGNRLYLIHMINRGGLGSSEGKPSAEYLQVLKLRDELVEEFDGYIREGDELATPREFLRRWVGGLKAIGGAINEDTLVRYRKQAAMPEAKAPFPRWMVP